MKLTQKILLSLALVVFAAFHVLRNLRARVFDIGAPFRRTIRKHSSLLVPFKKNEENEMLRLRSLMLISQITFGGIFLTLSM
jgi:hypothetical protein